jgi:hypothetical protein
LGLSEKNVMGGKDDRMRRLEGDGEGGGRQTVKPDTVQTVDPSVNVFYPECGGAGIEIAAGDASGGMIRGLGSGRFTAA